LLPGFAKGVDAMGEEMATVRGTLTLLEALSEEPASKRRLLETLREAGIYRNERTVRRWLGVFRESGFDI
jgi:hypothetical protein